MKTQPSGPIPEKSVRVAEAVFPEGHVYIHIRNVLEAIYDDKDFAELSEVRGRPAIAPRRLALVRIVQCSSGLPDWQSAQKQ
jgi:transposase